GLREKIETIATEVYGADGVEYAPAAARSLDLFERSGWTHLPICMAKTHLSLSADATLRGAPTGWTLPVRKSGPLSAPASSIPSAGRCRRCPRSAPTQPLSISIPTTTARQWVCSEPPGCRVLPRPPR